MNEKWKKFLKDYKRFLVIFVFLSLFNIPLLSLAQADDASSSKLIPCDGIETPCDFYALVQLINNIIEYVFIYIISPVATLMIVWSGIMTVYESSQGKDPSTYKEILRKVVIGFFLSFSAWVIVKAVVFGLTPESGTTDANSLTDYLRGIF